MQVGLKVSMLRSGRRVALVVWCCTALAACDPKLPAPGPPQPKADEVVIGAASAACALPQGHHRPV